MMLRSTLSALGFAVLGANALGCAARGGATVVAGASVDTYIAEPGYPSSAEVIIEEPAPQRVVFREPPPLVVVEPNVYVVENASYSIYFVDGFYWHIGSGGHWYRASRWDEPWVTVDLHYVPTRIVHRDHHAYVHFRASASAEVWRQPRERGERALRVERRDDRKARIDKERKSQRRLERPTPAARPLPKPAQRRDDDARGRDDRRTAPKVDRDDRKRVEPPRAVPPRSQVDRKNKPEPRPQTDPKKKPAVEEARPQPDVDQARALDKKKARKKAEEKRKLKEKDRGRARPIDR